MLLSVYQLCNKWGRQVIGLHCSIVLIFLVSSNDLSYISVQVTEYGQLPAFLSCAWLSISPIKLALANRKRLDYGMIITEYDFFFFFFRIYCDRDSLRQFLKISRSQSVEPVSEIKDIYLLKYIYSLLFHYFLLKNFTVIHIHTNH